MSIKNKIPKEEEFENLFVNNAGFDEIQAYYGRFNPIKVMGVERRETRHSAILGWLLNPQETHGLGDNFLKSFLAEAFRGYEGSEKPTALEVFQADLMDAEITLEWKGRDGRRIDLLVQSLKNGWVFIIENKFDSKQHSGQLKKYMEDVKKEKEYNSLRGVFLTLWEEEPDDERYATITYETIYNLLESQFLSGRYHLPSEAESFLNHYLEVIREAAKLLSEEQKEMTKLARNIYQNHENVINFILNDERNKSNHTFYQNHDRVLKLIESYGKRTKFTIACENVFDEVGFADLEYFEEISVDGSDFIVGWVDPNEFNFLPKSWFNAFGGKKYNWHGCENYGSAYPLSIGLHNILNKDDNTGQIKLYGYVVPLKPDSVRFKLIEIISSVSKMSGIKKIKIRNAAIKEKNSKFLTNNFFPIKNVQDADEIKNAILSALKSFKPEIDAVAEALEREKFYKYGNVSPQS